MSELQWYLLGGGAVFVALVFAYNVVTERRARQRAEQAFGEGPGDALFEKPRAVEPEARREPTLGELPAADPPPRDEGPAHKVQPEELEAPGGPAAEISSRIDSVAVILADDPVTADQLDPLLDALQSHTTPVRVEGIVDEQWHPVESSPRRSWRELRAGLQLASRSGPVGEEEIERFNAAIAEFAASVGAVSQREAPATAAARALEIDRFCADADIEVAVNVVGQFGASFPVAKVKALALELGMSETGTGVLVSHARDGSIEFTLRPFADAAHKAAALTWPGLTFALDLPHVAEAPEVFVDMVKVAEAFAAKLAGQLVDDNRKPLTEPGIAALKRTLEQVVRDMEAHGVPAGGELARRLFA